MHLEVTFRNLGARPEVRERAAALFKKLERFVDPACEAHLTVALEHGSTEVELVLTTFGQTHKLVEEHDDLRTALDRLFHRAENQLRRAKERRVDRWHEGNPDEDGIPRVDTGEEFVNADYADSVD